MRIRGRVKAVAVSDFALLPGLLVAASAPARRALIGRYAPGRRVAACSGYRIAQTFRQEWDRVFETPFGTKPSSVAATLTNQPKNVLYSVEPVEKCRCGGSSLGVEDALRADVLASISLDAAMR
jgi:hypothetical protein